MEPKKVNEEPESASDYRDWTYRPAHAAHAYEQLETHVVGDFRDRVRMLTPSPGGGERVPVPSNPPDAATGDDGEIEIDVDEDFTGRGTKAPPIPVRTAR